MSHSHDSTGILVERHVDRCERFCLTVSRLLPVDQQSNSPSVSHDLCSLQGRASDVVVWKADQQYPMAVLHQKAAATVPAVAIERTPWGQHAEANSLRLVSCSDTGQVCSATCMRALQCVFVGPAAHSGSLLVSFSSTGVQCIACITMLMVEVEYQACL